MNKIQAKSLAVLGLVLALGGGIVFAGADALAPAKELSQTFRAVAKHAAPAVVSIRARHDAIPAMDGMPDLLGPWGRLMPHAQAQPQWGQGSGFVVAADGLILTNHHVVNNAKEVLVGLQDGRELKATLVGSDASSDVALLRVDAKNLPYLSLADSDEIQVGDWVVAIGNPFGLSETVTAGIVSAKGRNQVGIADHENFLQTDAAINPGNSGGPLLDLEGNVVGMNTAIYSRTGGSMGIGFAIPSNLARSIEEQLLQNGKVVRGFLGVTIQPLTPELAASFGTESRAGALVAEVSPGSPADHAGLAAGDLIVAVDGKAAKNVGDVRNRIALLQPGTATTVTVLREGKRMDLAVTLGSREADALADAHDFGFEVAPARGDEENGVVVTTVVPGSLAETAGLRPGARILEIDRRPVEGVGDFRHALATASKSGRVLLRVEDDAGTRYIVLSRR